MTQMAGFPADEAEGSEIEEEKEEDGMAGVEGEGVLETEGDLGIGVALGTEVADLVEEEEGEALEIGAEEEEEVMVTEEGDLVEEEEEEEVVVVDSEAEVDLAVGTLVKEMVEDTDGEILVTIMEEDLVAVPSMNKTMEDSKGETILKLRDPNLLTFWEELKPSLKLSRNSTQRSSQ